MNSKTLIAGVIGGLALFAMGGLIYLVLAADFFASAVDKAEPAIHFIVLGEIIFGIILAYVITASNTTGVADSAKCGAITGFLFALGLAFLFAGAYEIWDLSTMLIDAVVWGVRWAVAGAAIGWYVGRGAGTE